MTEQTTEDPRRIAWVPLDEIQEDPSNPKAHADELIDASIGRHGVIDLMTRDDRTGYLISGHGRLHTIRSRRQAGATPPPGVRQRQDGTWLVPVVVGWASADDLDAQAALIGLNQTTILGGWLDDALLSTLDQLRDADALAGVGFDDAAIEALRAQLHAAQATPKPAKVRAPATGPGTAVLHQGDCIDIMATMQPDSVDAVVCDPPYGISFMGREWDTKGAHEFESWCKTWGAEALRVLKPGGHLIAFGATRTHHRLMAGLEDAGFEIRDCGVWLYRSGFPKSLDVSKAIDNAAGAVRDDRRTSPIKNTVFSPEVLVEHAGTPVTAAAAWEGWGTALKPAIEPWVLARKPLAERTVAANVQKWGTGALNIGATRVGEESLPAPERGATVATSFATGGTTEERIGRWPANVVTENDDDDLRFFRMTSGVAVDTPKASSSEKPWAGHLPMCPATDADDVMGTACTCGRGNGGSSTHTNVCATCGATSWHRFETGCPKCGGELIARDTVNLHPTVKPVALMRHLVRLVTPPSGTVLDPFAGTGTTGEAAVLEGFDAILIEREDDYLPWIKARLDIDPTTVASSTLAG